MTWHVYRREPGGNDERVGFVEAPTQKSALSRAKSEYGGRLPRDLRTPGAQVYWVVSVRRAANSPRASNPAWHVYRREPGGNDERVGFVEAPTQKSALSRAKSEYGGRLPRDLRTPGAQVYWVVSVRRAANNPRHANPVPSRWTPARVRTLPNGETQVMFTGKDAARVARTLGKR